MSDLCLIQLRVLNGFVNAYHDGFVKLFHLARLIDPDEADEIVRAFSDNMAEATARGEIEWLESIPTLDHEPTDPQWGGQQGWVIER